MRSSTCGNTVVGMLILLISRLSRVLYCVGSGVKNMVDDLSGFRIVILLCSFE